MKHSENLKELASALAKAQAEVQPAFKTGFNPHFKSHFADFASVLDACEDALAKHGLAIVQAPVSDENGVGVETMLLHSSGEWLSERFTLPLTKKDAQGGGSCITYCRRYALEGFMRIRREDDDGEEASKPAQQNAKPQTPPRDLKGEAEKIMREGAKRGVPAFKAACDTLSAEQKRAVGKGLYETLLAESQKADVARKPQKETVAS